jgi:Major Facilitator Superfamily
MALAVIADMVPLRERGRYQGYFADAMTTANALGPILGGFFAQALSWPWIFWINLPVGLAACILSSCDLVRLPFPARRVTVDWASAVLIVAAVTLILIGIGDFDAIKAWPSLRSMISGRPASSHTACSLEFKPPLVRPIRRGTARFEQTGRRPMRLEVGRIDHQPVGLSTLSSEFGEYPAEHAQTASADEAVEDRLIRTVVFRRISPAQIIPDHRDDPADQFAVIDPRHSMRQRKIGLDPVHLHLRKQKQIAHGDALRRHQRISRSPEPQRT